MKHKADIVLEIIVFAITIFALIKFLIKINNIDDYY
jgi:hypothetical protein